MEQLGGKKSNKITEIVRLQQMLKKWRKLSVASSKDTAKPAMVTVTAGGTNNGNSSNGNGGESKAKKFLKRTLSFTESPPPSSSSGPPPKGHLAVSVGPAMRRFVIPTEYLKHQAFAALLREAEEEFGFQQEGLLRIPCDVSTFQAALRAVQGNKDATAGAAAFSYCSAEFAISDDVARTPNNSLCR